jgi:hypothetical protein
VEAADVARLYQVQPESAVAPAELGDQIYVIATACPTC